jgi:hypothetical protein
MSTSLERKAPKMVARLTVMSPEISLSKPSAVLNLQSYSIENGILSVVAHRHDDQLRSIRPNLEKDQPEIFCTIDLEDHQWVYKARYLRSADEHLEKGVYPVIRFQILDVVASVGAANSFSKFNDI